MMKLHLSPASPAGQQAGGPQAGGGGADRPRDPRGQPKDPKEPSGQQKDSEKEKPTQQQQEQQQQQGHGKDREHRGGAAGAGSCPSASSCPDLMGNSLCLAEYFSHLFEKPGNQTHDKNRKEKKKCKKCKKAGPKTKDKRKMEPLTDLLPALPEVSVGKTPSPFAVFAAVRSTCLESRQRQAALLQLQAAAAWKEAADDADDADDKDKDDKKAISNLPKIVSIGLSSVFEIIKESQTLYPVICKKALSSLLNIVQGLQPEEMSKDPSAVMEPLFQTLLELASAVPVQKDAGTKKDSLEETDDGSHIRALAGACVLSFAVALGDTGKMLQAVAK